MNARRPAYSTPLAGIVIPWAVLLGYLVMESQTASSVRRRIQPIYASNRSMNLTSRLRRWLGSSFTSTGLVVLAALFSLVVPASAQITPARDSKWIVRVHGVGILTSGNEIVVRQAIPPADVELTRHSVGDGAGFDLELERLVGRRLGVEISVILGGFTNDFSLDSAALSLRDSDRIGTYSTTVGVNYHLLGESRFDFHVGAFAGMINFDDIIFLTEVGRVDKRTFDDDTGFGAKVGVDVGLGKSESWTLSIAARYFVVIMEGEVAGQDLDLNPVLLSLGVGRRF